MIQITEEMKTAIDNALTDSVPMIVASIDPTGQPSLSFRGSTHVHSDHELAIWIRNPEGGLLKSIAVNPKMALMYRNPAERKTLLIHGEASRVEDAALRQRIYDESPERERNQDPEQKGAAVLVDVVRVIERGQVTMER